MWVERLGPQAVTGKLEDVDDKIEVIAKWQVAVGMQAWKADVEGIEPAT